MLGYYHSRYSYRNYRVADRHHTGPIVGTFGRANLARDYTQYATTLTLKLKTTRCT